MTSWCSASNVRVTHEPMNPAPPVTSTFIRAVPLSFAACRPHDTIGATARACTCVASADPPCEAQKSLPNDAATMHLIGRKWRASARGSNPGRHHGHRRHHAHRQRRRDLLAGAHRRHERHRPDHPLRRLEALRPHRRRGQGLRADGGHGVQDGAPLAPLLAARDEGRDARRCSPRRSSSTTNWRARWAASWAPAAASSSMGNQETIIETRGPGRVDPLHHPEAAASTWRRAASAASWGCAGRTAPSAAPAPAAPTRSATPGR